MKQSEIKFKVSLDDNHLPEKITWQASDSEQQDLTDAKAIMLSMWDSKENATMRIDLWTKDMSVEDMKLFFHQTFVSMVNTLERATGADKTTKQMHDFAQYIAEEMELIKKS